MKTICSRWSVLALVLGTAATGVGCSSDPGETGPGSETGTGTGEDSPSIGTRPSLDSTPNNPGSNGVAPELKPAPAKKGDPGTPVNARARVTGIVTDLGGGVPRLGLGGTGTLAKGVGVRLSELTASGELKLLTEVKIDVSGNFSAQLPLGLNLVIAQVVDISGKILGSAIVGATGSVNGGIVVAAPITTETSIEVSVLLDIGSCKLPATTGGTSGTVALGLDVSALVDAKLAASLVAAVKAGVDAKLLIHVLANATVSAAQARLQVLVDAGVKIDVDAMLKARVEALARLNAGLNSALNGNASLADVTAQLLIDLDAALDISANVSANVRVRAQVAANLAFAATLSTSLQGNAHAQPVVFASVHAAAKIEAQIAASAIADIVRLAGGSQAAIDLAVAAGIKLQADVDAAVDLKALTQARLDFLAVLSGNGQTSGGLLGNLLLKATGDVQLALASLLDAVGKLSVDLEAKLSVQTSAMVKTDVCVDVNASVDLDLKLSAMIKLLAKFSADVHALGPSVSVQGGATADLTVKALADLLATVEILMRVQL